MQNILLRYCREANGYTIRTIAARLGITPAQYLKLEEGHAHLGPQQAQQLEKLYRVKGYYFYIAALHLELLHNCHEMVSLQKQTIRQLKEELPGVRRGG